MTHTLEPWETHAIGSEGYTLARKFESVKHLSTRDKILALSPIGRIDGGDWSLLRANAERIVACVNACEGINPEAVPDLLGTLEHAERVFNTPKIDPLQAFVMIERMKFIIDKAEKEG